MHKLSSRTRTIIIVALSVVLIALVAFVVWNNFIDDSQSNIEEDQTIIVEPYSSAWAEQQASEALSLVYAGVGATSYNLDKIDPALAMLDEDIASDQATQQDKAFLHLTKASILADYKGDTEAALKEVLITIELTPQDAFPYSRAGQYYKLLDQTEKAREYIEKALTVNDTEPQKNREGIDKSYYESLLEGLN